MLLCSALTEASQHLIRLLTSIIQMILCLVSPARCNLDFKVRQIEYMSFLFTRVKASTFQSKTSFATLVLCCQCDSMCEWSSACVRRIGDEAYKSASFCGMISLFFLANMTCMAAEWINESEWSIVEAS